MPVHRRIFLNFLLEYRRKQLPGPRGMREGREVDLWSYSRI